MHIEQSAAEHLRLRGSGQRGRWLLGRRERHQSFEVLTEHKLMRSLTDTTYTTTALNPDAN